VPKNSPGSIGVAATEVSRILGQRYDLFNFPVKAGFAGNSAEEVSCVNASAEQLVIVFKEQDLNAVTLSAPNCITVGAMSADDAIAVADAFMYHVLRIMPKEQNATSSAPIAKLPRAVPSKSPVPVAPAAPLANASNSSP
jgi:hypothetical protein